LLRVVKENFFVLSEIIENFSDIAACLAVEKRRVNRSLQLSAFLS
jgi:hypothetical protein